ncbi:hypothetical protein Tco_0816607, partial [Tanacetum coccineum]
MNEKSFLLVDSLSKTLKDCNLDLEPGDDVTRNCAQDAVLDERIRGSLVWSARHLTIGFLGHIGQHLPEHNDTVDPPEGTLVPRVQLAAVADEVAKRILDKVAKEAEAQTNLKLVEQHILDKEVNTLIEGDEDDVVAFAKNEEETTEAELIRRKGEGSLEVRNTSITTLTRSLKIDFSLDKDE